MGYYLAALAAGFLLLPLLPALPPYWAAPSAACLFYLLFGWFRRPVLLVLALWLTSFSWAVWVAGHAVESRLPTQWEGKNIRAEGYVRGIPEANELGLRFRFEPHQAQSEQGEALSVKGHWHLFATQMQLPPPDGHCSLTVRLKRPHGVVNPSGFDTEAWLLSEGITASGSVRALQCTPPIRVTIDNLRLSLREFFQKNFSQAPMAGVVLSLITGDRSLITAEQWERYVATGVVHLMAISGLHITMIALVAAALLRFLLGFIPRLALRYPLGKPALAGGLVLAGLYSLMAGYSVPTERTLVMLSVVVILQIMERRLLTWQILLIAMNVVLFLSPLAIHATGFWLSFGAVAILLMLGVSAGELPKWQTLIFLQVVLTLLLLPLTLWFFERVSWVSPMANLIAVPWITFLVVPLGLLGLLLWLLGLSAIPILSWKLAIILMTGLDALLEQLQQWPAASIAWSIASISALLWLLLAVLILVQPVQRWLWGLLPVFLVALWWPPLAPAREVLRVTVLDVGQGLSVLLQTAHHQLLYDTGPPIGEQSDAGERYILPSLHRLGIYHLDKLVLSHGDSDHTGGAASVLQGIRVDGISGPHLDGVAVPSSVIWENCEAGQSWVWDGWRFEFLYPSQADRTVITGDNDLSCVLRVSRAGRAVLLPGDLERRGEQHLLARIEPEALKADVLVLGHHGSKGSSSLPWVAAVSPQWALASAGYRNRFHHPSRSLLRRLEQTGVQWRNTAWSGALTVELSETGIITPQGWREREPRYWRDRQQSQ